MWKDNNFHSDYRGLLKTVALFVYNKSIRKIWDAKTIFSV